MADGTVTGEYRLTTIQARRELGSLSREAAKADASTEKLGRDLDKVGSTKQQAQIRKLRNEVRLLTSTSRSGQREVNKLMREVERLGAAATSANTGRGGGRGRGVGGVTLGGLVGMNQSLVLVAAKAAIALPAIRALAGGLAALGVTAASAAGGAGAVGAAGLAGVATGIGGILSVAIPAKKAISEAAEAQKKYNEAVRDYGRASREAGEARDVMRMAYSGAPRGTRSLIGEANAFGAAWKRATRQGSESLVGFMREVIRVASTIRKPLAEIANRVTNAFSSQGGKFARFMGSERMLRGMRAGAGIFTENIGNIRRVGQAAIEMYVNVVRASRPFVKQFTDFLAKWFGRGQRRSRDIKEMRTAIGGMVDDLKSVARLGGSGIRLLMALLGSGGARAGGRSLLRSATEQLDKWTAWVNKNPTKIRSFFRETVAQTKELGNALKTVVSWLYKASESLAPLLNGLTDIAGLLSGLGMGGTLVGVGTAMRTRKGFQNRKAAGTGAGGGGTGGGGGGILAVPGGGGGPRKPRVTAGSRVPGKPNLIGPPGTVAAKSAPWWRGGAGKVGTAGKVVGKAAWPITAALAGLGALGTEGDLGRRLHGAGAMVIPGLKPPRRFSDLEQEGVDRAGGFTGGLGAQDTRAGLNRLQAEVARGEGLLNQRTTRRTVKGKYGPTIQTSGRELRGDERKTFKAYIDALNEELKVRKLLVGELQRERSMINADAATEDLKTAFSRRLRRTKSPERAGEAFVSGSLRQIDKRTTVAGKMRQAKGAIAEMNLLRQKYPQLGDEYDELAARIKKRFDAINRHVYVVNGKIYTNTKNAWADIRASISTEAERSAQEASKWFTVLQRQAAQGLVDMGFSRSDANSIIRGREKGGKAGKRANNAANLGPQGLQTTRERGEHSRVNNARGGRIRGRGLMDTVPLVDGSAAAPGELIVNRHTEDEHDSDARALGLPTLAQRINGQRRPHSAPRRRTRHTDAYAVGGRIGMGDMQTTNLKGADSGLAPYAALGASYGLHVTSGLRRGSITSSGNASLHGSGAAIDVSGSASGMLSYGRAMAEQYGTGLDELIHTPMGFGVKDGRKVAPYAEADHFDHVHVGDRTPGGAFGPITGGPNQASAGGFLSIPLLEVPRSGLKGLPGVMAQRAMEIYTAGINQRLQSIGGGASGAPGAMPGGNVDAWLTEALTITGQYSAANLSALRGRVMQESGGDPRAQNNWDSNAAKGIPSKGLVQTIDPTFQAHSLPGMQDIWNPVHNAVAAIRYMLSRYGHIVAANGKGYETGGRMGSDFFRKALGTPSLFANKSTGGEIKVSVNIANVNVGSDGNAGAVGAQIGEQVAAKLAGALRKAAVI